MYKRQLWLWGQRTGCLLAIEAANRMERPVNLLFWQPVVSGKQFLQRFLRLKIAAEMLGGDGKGMMERMRSQLRRGEAAEIAGYLLSSTLAGSLENAEPVSYTHLDVYKRQMLGDLRTGPN